MLEHLNKHILSEHPTQIEQTAAYRKKFDKIIEADEDYHEYTDDSDNSESDQGNLLKGVDKKTVRREGMSLLKEFLFIFSS